ncbi:hypothetical protein EG68_05573 [Paragonimus skrjabini miyazakii]|uniref:Uncharacterized protein n=1 Tax=Paragonimus skrjabini miyazakii TaxID=59628 RepID=A0A8S9YQH6_9TREM|nr:hypothetical protein EG68_05573 [Paragonimus skrjabini miyazakii]
MLFSAVSSTLNFLWSFKIVFIFRKYSSLVMTTTPQPLSALRNTRCCMSVSSFMAR